MPKLFFKVVSTAPEDHARLLYRDDSGEIHCETELLSPTRRADHFGGDYVGMHWLTDAEAQHIQRVLDLLRESLPPEGEKARRKPFLLQAALVELNAADPAELAGPPG